MRDVSFARDDVHNRWFAADILNAFANYLDRHLPERAEQTAVLWEGDNPADQKALTYTEMFLSLSRRRKDLNLVEN